MQDEITADIEKVLLQLELESLRPEVRHDAERLSVLLAEDFREFGSSGRVFSRADITEALGLESQTVDSQTEVSISDFSVRVLAPDIVLVTYRAVRKEAGVASWRSSLWIHRDHRWRMIFHQGTKIP